MADFTPDSNFEEDYTITGRELTTFVLQPGFVESIIPEKKSVSSIREAFQFIFRNNKEYGVILWNGIPVKFSYTEDLPLMIEPLIALLAGIGKNEQTVCFETPGFSIEWYAKLDEENNLLISQSCKHIRGSYELILNQLGIVSIKSGLFLCEWKLLLNQLIEAFDRSEINFINKKDQELIDQIRDLNVKIEGVGSLYMYSKT